MANLSYQIFIPQVSSLHCLLYIYVPSIYVTSILLCSFYPKFRGKECTRGYKKCTLQQLPLTCGPSHFIPDSLVNVNQIKVVNIILLIFNSDWILNNNFTRKEKVNIFKQPNLKSVTVLKIKKKILFNVIKNWHCVYVAPLIYASPSLQIITCSEMKMLNSLGNKFD